MQFMCRQIKHVYTRFLVLHHLIEITILITKPVISYTNADVINYHIYKGRLNGSDSVTYHHYFKQQFVFGYIQVDRQVPEIKKNSHQS